MTRSAKVTIATLLVLLLSGSMWFANERRSAHVEKRAEARAAVQAELENAKALLAK